MSLFATKFASTVIWGQAANFIEHFLFWIRLAIKNYLGQRCEYVATWISTGHEIHHRFPVASRATTMIYEIFASPSITSVARKPEFLENVW